MSNNLIIVVPGEAELFAISKQAAAKHLLFLTDGNSSVLSPLPIPGWFPVNSGMKPQAKQVSA